MTCWQVAGHLADGRVGFGGLVDTSYLLDPAEGRVRLFVRADQRRMERLLDVLPHFDLVQCVGQSRDMPDALLVRLTTLETAVGRTKAILDYLYDGAGALDLLELAAIVADRGGTTYHRPFLLCASVPVTPLSASEYNLEILLTCDERGLPVLYYCCPALGGSSPARWLVRWRWPMPTGSSGWRSTSQNDPARPLCLPVSRCK